MYVNNLIEEIMGEVTLPSHIYGDNAASLFLAQNNQMGQRTKHIDIRHRFIHDMITNQVAELRHIRSEDNPSDLNSKNVSVETHKRLSDRVYEGVALVRLNKEDVAEDTG